MRSATSGFCRHLPAAAVLLASSACVESGPAACVPTCQVEKAVHPVGNSSKETSGLAASALHKGVFYAHNDSGDMPRFFAIGADGADLGTYNLVNAAAVDWEDMARGPCTDPEKSCLYFGDLGDNDKNRSAYAVYRVEEPASLAPGSHDLTAEEFAFEYPDGSHDAEALLVEPQTGRVYVVTKDRNNTRIYAFPLPLDGASTATLDFLGRAEIPGANPRVTGGDIHPSGESIILRTKASLLLYSAGSGTSVEGALSQPPCLLPSADEAQGESVAWTLAGDGYVTMGEGANEDLHVFGCP